ncbi:MAG: hypothetical protein IKO59_02140 [Bacteroidales bacterium]|jgi:hypothetical protein|nr:hypothetical protein [Bacteroidales bacterium]
MMKKNIFVWLTFIFILCDLSISCKREFHAFPYELRDYFPYVGNQKLTFVNDCNQHLSGSISTMHTSETYYLPYTCKCGDGYDSQKSFTIDSDSLYINGVMDTRSSAFLMTFRCRFGTGTTLDIDMQKEFYGDPFSGNFSKTVGDTVILEKGNDRMVVIKGKGIAEIKAGDDVWHLKE